MGKSGSGGLSGVWQLVSALAHFSGDQRPALFRVLYLGWRIAGNIGQDRSFHENASFLKKIAYCPPGIRSIFSLEALRCGFAG